MSLFWKCLREQKKRKPENNNALLNISDCFSYMNLTTKLFSFPVNCGQVTLLSTYQKKSAKKKRTFLVWGHKDNMDKWFSLLDF